jgi:hypothetical protein
MWSGLGNGALQALQFLKGFGEARQGPCGALGILRALRFSPELCAQILDRGEFFQDRAIEACNGVGYLGHCCARVDIRKFGFRLDRFVTGLRQVNESRAPCHSNA